jgi:hypothetical protein
MVSSRKSTPLSAIPTMSKKPADEGFVAPQQQSEMLPLISDDDSTIKELLNKFNNSNTTTNNNTNINVAPVPVPAPPPVLTQERVLASPPMTQQMESDEDDVEASLLDRLVTHYVTDAELLVLFFASYLVVSFAPIGKLVNRYIYTFPNLTLVDLLSKSLVATILAYISYVCVARSKV